MADSTYLKNVVEPFIVDWVSKEIGVDLKPTRLTVGPRTDGTRVHFEFDGVSADETVALLVSTCQTIKPGGVRKLHVDASILLQVPFKRRIMAFISDEVRANFLNKCDGLLPLSNIEILVCDEIPAEMQDAIQAFQADAKTEVGDKGRKWNISGLRK